MSLYKVRECWISKNIHPHFPLTILGLFIPTNNAEQTGLGFESLIYKSSIFLILRWSIKIYSKSHVYYIVSCFMNVVCRCEWHSKGYLALY